jgi:Uma2 family endonuclease
MPLSEATYRAVVLEDPDGHWELHRGRLREKPPMTFAHNHLAFWLGVDLANQLDEQAFVVRIDAGRVRRQDELFYIPDVYVVPATAAQAIRDRADILEVYDEPLPLVVEVWSPSTATYDTDKKLPEYMRRGDREIWRLHPYERSLTIWCREQDGSYVERVVTGGIVEPTWLPGVKIDLDRLFDRL